MKRQTFLIAIAMLMATISTNAQVEQAVDEIFSDYEETLIQDEHLGTGLLLVHSPSLGIHRKTAVHHEPSVSAYPDQPYHLASIGKMFTSVVIAMLCEDGRIRFNDHISKYLDKSITDGLHVYEGVDYSDSLRIRHLLNHSSGLADMYADEPREGKSLRQMMLDEPGRMWGNRETVLWAKENLGPRFAPGGDCYYSDTNYELLGLIIESITGQPYHQVVHRMVFKPLGMVHSYFLHHSQPEVESPYPPAALYHNGINLMEAKSVSISYASGGVVSTTEDMLLFMKALAGNHLLSPETMQRMQTDRGQLGWAMYYGYGLMQFTFLMMPDKYDIWGHSGSIGSFAYYNPGADVFLIGSYHKLALHSKPIFFINKALRRINKEL